MKDKNAHLRIEYTLERLDNLRSEVKGLQEQIDEQQNRLNKHYDMIRVPEVRVWCSNISVLNPLDTVSMPISNIIHMILTHLNLELQNETMQLKEIVDDDNQT